MGLQNRDYARESSNFGGGGGTFVSSTGGVVKKIVIATAAVFLLQLLTQNKSGNLVTAWLGVDYTAITGSGQVWRLLTYALCHSTHDPLHIIFNLYLLWMLGREVEELYGSKEFAWFYGVSAVFGAICYLMVGMVLAYTSKRGIGQMTGASGAVIACLVLYALHYPRRKVYVWGVIAVEMRWLVGVAVALDLYPLIAELFNRKVVDITGANVAHACHLGGALFGWFYFKRQIRLSNIIKGGFLGVAKKKIKARQSDLKLFAPADSKPAENKPRPSTPSVSGEQVDALLAKISEQGEESLTDREREILKEASRQYRDK